MCEKLFVRDCMICFNFGCATYNDNPSLISEWEVKEKAWCEDCTKDFCNRVNDNKDSEMTTGICDKCLRRLLKRKYAEV